MKPVGGRLYLNQALVLERVPILPGGDDQGVVAAPEVAVADSGVAGGREVHAVEGAGLPAEAGAGGLVGEGAL